MYYWRDLLAIEPGIRGRGVHRICVRFRERGCRRRRDLRGHIKGVSCGSAFLAANFTNENELPDSTGDIVVGKWLRGASDRRCRDSEGGHGTAANIRQSTAG